MGGLLTCVTLMSLMTHISVHACVSLSLMDNLPQEHFSSLKMNFVHLESKQRLLSSMVRGDDSGVYSDVERLIKQQVGVEQYQQQQKNIIQQLKDKNEDTKSFLNEIKLHTNTLCTRIRQDITKLLQSQSHATHHHCSSSMLGLVSVCTLPYN